jgi:hypothetical protein
MKINFKKLAKSFTGFSTPVFGVSWNPPKSDREIVRELITFFEDRRALYNPYDMETSMWVVESVLEIRKKLTDTLEKIDENSDITPHLRAMRAACRKFMDESGKFEKHRHYHMEKFFTDLGEMRAVFGIHIGQLCVKYGINIESDLATILPIEDDEIKKIKGKKMIGRNSS